MVAHGWRLRMEHDYDVVPHVVDLDLNVLIREPADRMRTRLDGVVI